MTRPLRILRNVAIGLAALLVVLAVTGVLVLRSAWFQNYVKQTIITDVEDSTGGKVEIGTFHVDWTHLSAVATDFVIHGTEAAGTPPMLRAARVQLDVRLLPSRHHFWDITYLGIDQPQANVIVYPDGRTNIPSPRQKSTSNQPPLQTVVDLAIGRFELTSGLVTFAQQKQELNVRANNLRAQLSYSILRQEYSGQVSLQPVYVVAGRNTPVDFTVNVPLVLTRNRIDVHDARIFSPASAITLNASIQDLRNPNISAHAAGHIALADLKNAPNVPVSLKAVIDLDSDISVRNNTINITGLRAAALGSEFSGNVSLKDFRDYQVHGDLKHLDLANAIRAAGQAQLPYDAVLSGPIDIAGNLNAGMRGLTAQAKFSLRPGSRGIPLSGNLTANYLGARDDISIQKSLLTLPHSRLSVDGSVGKQLNVALTTTNLDDLFAALPRNSRPQVALEGGQASFKGKITGGLTNPNVAGHVTAERLSLAGRQFDSFNADASITKHDVAIQNGGLSRNAMQARFAGTLGLQNWKPLPSSPLSINGSIQNGDLADLLALAGQQSNGYSGQLSANVGVTGTLGNPQGSGSVVVANGMAQGQPFDRAEAQLNLTDQLVTVQNAYVQLGSARVNVNGQFQHPRDSFTTGQLRASFQSDSVNLAQVNNLQKQKPNTAGIIQINAQINANVTANSSQEFQLTSVNGSAAVRGLQWGGKAYGDLTATATTSGQAVNYNLTSNFAGSTIRVDGNTQLAPDYPSTARANLSNLPVERLLAILNRTDIPIQGTLSGSANFSGTIANPQGSADLTLANGKIYQDAVDRVHAKLNYLPRSIDVPQLELVSGPSRLDLTAHYDHPAGDLESGNLQIHLDTNSIDLARIKTLAEKRPGLGGTLQLNASATAQVRAAGPRFLVQDLSGNLKTTALSVRGKNLGDLTLAANTSGGRTNFTLNSGIAGATIEGHGSVELANNYSTDAQLTLKNVTSAGLRPLLGYAVGEGRGFEAEGDAQVAVNGPLMDPQQLRGTVQVTRLQVSGAPSAFRTASPMVLQNQGPIAATLDRGALKIQGAHLTGPQTDFQASGTIPLNGQSMDIDVKGNVNLAVLQQFDRSITSAGNVVVTAGVRGSATNPQLTGQVELKNASFDYTGLPTGVWKANGVVALNGNSAVIRKLTAEAGGGQVNVTGSATLTDTLRFAFEAKANRMRVMIQQGVGVVASANVSLSGTSDNSSLTGAVTVEQVSYAAQSDLGSILSLAAPPVQAPSTPLPLLENMRLDVRVRSSNALGVQSSLAENVQLTTDLRVRGTAANPGVLGRVLITEGKLVFFGSTYTVNSGTIGFYNPIRIEPVLDLSLETKTQGVDVVVRITGPIDNMKLSYTSDPPLQFQEIVNLLATGSTPTSDPTLLANQPALPAQSFQQIGESAIVGRALADPVTNQLQRVFGVTQLKINPAFASGSQLPETQITLQQQISNNVSFTYQTGLNTANAQTIQAVWTFTPQWSAQALRDYNGIFSLTLIYKRQIR